MLLTYPIQQEVDRDELLQVWCDVLKDVDEIALKTAAVEYLRSANQWRPAPGILRDRAMQLTGEHPKTQAEKMWDRIMERHENNHGGNYGVDQEALVIMASIGGWDRLTNGDTGFVRHEFIELYQAKKQNEQALAFPVAENIKRLT